MTLITDLAIWSKMAGVPIRKMTVQTPRTTGSGGNRQLLAPFSAS